MIFIKDFYGDFTSFTVTRTTDADNILDYMTDDIISDDLIYVGY